MNLSLNKELTLYTLQHDNPIIRSSKKLIASFLKFNTLIPDSHNWTFTTTESLQEQMFVANKNHYEINNIFWKDQTSNIEAYAYMTFWRGAELINSALASLNNKELIVAAVATRSLLELSTVFLLNANTIHKTFSQVDFSKGEIIVSTELEELVLKMIWGTRYNNPEPLFTQKNIMTYLDKLAKNHNATELMPTYSFLCDITHPNFIGNLNYWSHLKSELPHGQEIILLSRSSSRQFNTNILDKIIWGLAWSSDCIKNSYNMLVSANELVLKKIENS